jgi:hypothetical protein
MTKLYFVSSLLITHFYNTSASHTDQNNRLKLIKDKINHFYGSQYNIKREASINTPTIHIKVIKLGL